MSASEPTHAPAPPVWLWAILLGATGFLAGFVGPIVLNPDANQGPLVGIFITGPGGALVGATLGLVVRFSRVSGTLRRRLLLGTCLVYSVAILFFSLPEPIDHGYIVEGTILDCSVPGDLRQRTLARWNRQIAAVPWGQPRAGWQHDLDRLLRDDHGVVLSLSLDWKVTLHEQRRPWNKGQITATPWGNAQHSSKSFFARYAGGSCDAYDKQAGLLYFHARQESTAWPPDDLPDLLDLLVIERVPAEYRIFGR